MAHSRKNTNDQSEDSILSLENEFFRALLGRLEDPVFVKNNKHQWVFANRAFEDLIDCHDLIGKTDADLLPLDQVEKFYEGDDQVIRTQTSLTQEEQIGDGCYALVKKIPITLPDNTPGVFGIIFDISEYRKVQLEVEKLRLAKVQSQTDSLTGLSNRRHLEKHYQKLLDKSQASRLEIGMLHIDVDYFKEINDTKGHLIGDEVLVHLGRTLRTCVKADDFIARIGGDEFVIVVQGQSQLVLEGIAQRIINATNQLVQLENERCVLSVSIGVATDPDGLVTLNEMLKYADLALYRAKHNGRGRYEIFTTTIQIEHNALIRQRDDFRIALEEEQIIPFYQPQFDSHSLKITGVEALARWHHPERGILLPGEFLKTAMSEKRLVDIDRAIFRAAIRDAKELNDAGCQMPSLSVNVSPQSLATQDFIKAIKQMEPFPNRICFELVESMLLDDLNGHVSDNLDALREMGVSLDIDDFGSGHTSLLGMLEANPDRVKIDKRLIIPMIESRKHRNLVKSIIQIAESLCMDTIAEGVESEEHRHLLRKLGCSSVQGFGFARPMSFADLKVLLLNQAAA